MTALMIASVENHPDVVRTLLTYGASVYATDQVCYLASHNNIIFSYIMCCLLWCIRLCNRPGLLFHVLMNMIQYCFTQCMIIVWLLHQLRNVL